MARVSHKRRPHRRKVRCIKKLRLKKSLRKASEAASFVVTDISRKEAPCSGT